MKTEFTNCLLHAKEMFLVLHIRILITILSINFSQSTTDDFLPTTVEIRFARTSLQPRCGSKKLNPLKQHTHRFKITFTSSAKQM